MAGGSDLSVTFWGVRGSIPTPGRDTVRYGGETSCFEIRIGDRLIIIDAGSGLHRFGHALTDGTVPAGPPLPDTGETGADLLFTHLHFDHICGLPFFCPIYTGEFRLRARVGNLAHGDCATQAIGRLLSPPLFPLELDHLPGFDVSEFRAGDSIDLGDGVVVETVGLHHPGGSIGFRFEAGGARLAIITDHEHGDPAIDRALADFVAGCDVMVYDTMFADDEYDHHVGWGHSTPGRMLDLADSAGIRLPIAFHHSPDRTDDMLDDWAEMIDRRHPGALIAREGLTVPVGVALPAKQALRA